MPHSASWVFVQPPRGVRAALISSGVGGNLPQVRFLPGAFRPSSAAESRLFKRSGVSAGLAKARPVQTPVQTSDSCKGRMFVPR